MEFKETSKTKSDSYVSREEHVISRTYFPIDTNVVLRKNTKDDGKIVCEVCVTVDGTQFCSEIDCDRIVIKPEKLAQVFHVSKV